MFVEEPSDNYDAITSRKPLFVTIDSVEKEDGCQGSGTGW
jgi:hypothetical protein